jgi:hypothetical protein
MWHVYQGSSARQLRAGPLGAYQTFKSALNSGEFSDFQNIIMGGTRTLNGPQGRLAFCLEALDNAQCGQPQLPPPPATASDQNATELLEHYWASLLDGKASSDRNHLSATLASTTKLTAYPDLRGPNPRP